MFPSPLPGSRWPGRAALASLLVGLQMLPADSPAAEAGAAARPPQFVYVLRLPPRLHQQAAWTPDDQRAVSAHFEHLKQATAAGQVILAGRTGEPLDQTFGLVIFEAADEAAARRFMQADPAVAAGVMSATLHPYAVALMRR